uniref:Uncharacterized protein n=1 Tax=Rhizophora mucronata TaxID=61149 RepID=A0A2P2MY16_RHIMU
MKMYEFTARHCKYVEKKERILLFSHINLYIDSNILLLGTLEKDNEGI